MPPGICFTLFCGSVSATSMHLFKAIFYLRGYFYGVAECFGERTDCTAVCLMVAVQASTVTFAPCGRYLSETERYHKPF